MDLNYAVLIFWVCPQTSGNATNWQVSCWEVKSCIPSEFFHIFPKLSHSFAARSSACSTTTVQMPSGNMLPSARQAVSRARDVGGTFFWSSTWSRKLLRNLGNSHGYGIDGPVKFDDLPVESLKLVIFILIFHMLNSQRVNEHHEHTA